MVPTAVAQTPPPQVEVAIMAVPPSQAKKNCDRSIYLPIRHGTCLAGMMTFGGFTTNIAELLNEGINSGLQNWQSLTM